MPHHIRRMTAALLWAAAVAAAFPATARAAEELTPEVVRISIERGVDYLKKQQNKVRGNWAGHGGQPGGVTALCTLAMLNAGVPAEDPAVQRALGYLRKLGNPKMVYSTSLQTMVFCAAEPKSDYAAIVRHARVLVDARNATAGVDGASAPAHPQRWIVKVEGGATGEDGATAEAYLELARRYPVAQASAQAIWRAASSYAEAGRHAAAVGYYRRAFSLASSSVRSDNCSIMSGRVRGSAPGGLAPGRPGWASGTAGPRIMAPS